ncbi:2-isopropylmalate synthase [Candidatus Pacearchaeota archaeon]|nr:2-isopropylmalate synthase [Candidatus Pacearchaeota archaeon]
MDKIIFFDTTLRDGEQASGFHLLKDEKLKIAKALANLGVDIIEAGFAVSSPGDFESIQMIAKEVGTPDGPIICSLARAVEKDIEQAAKAIEQAHKKRIHTFIATSDEHIKEKFKKTREWVIEKAVNAVKKAKTYTDDVEFSCEDFGRTDKDYTVEVVCAAIKAGATTINLPDTVGWLTPKESYEKIDYVIKKVRKLGYDAIFSVHNHNDFGMATATTIEGISAGIRQVEVTINGIGERAGNTALEEIAGILSTKPEFKKLYQTNINTKLIGKTSKLISELTGVYPQPNKAIVGKNAFSHEAGIHQDGIIKNSSTYETMDPLDFGVESILTFGPRSGKNALKKKFNEIGININDDEFEGVSTSFKELTDDKKDADDADLILALRKEKNIPKYYQMINYNPINLDNDFGCVIEIKCLENTKRIYSEGDGQIDAAIKGIKDITNNNHLKLKDFSVKSLGIGSDAIGVAKVVVSNNSLKVIGKSKNPDVVTASIQAYINALNRMRYIEDYFKKTK